MVAEHGIVPDAQRGDAGQVAIAGFKRRNRTAAVLACGAKRVERGVIAFRDITALRRIERRRRNECDSEPVGQRRMAAEVGQEGRKQVGPIGLGGLFLMGLGLRAIYLA